MIYYQLKKKPEDFHVTEVKKINCSKNQKADYHYYLVTKFGFTTFQAIECLADHIGLLSKEIGYLGLKDEDGLTSQYFSLPIMLHEDNVHSFNMRFCHHEKRHITLQYFCSGDEHFKVSKLEGNLFKLIVRNLSFKICKELEKIQKTTLYFVNYYGGQRFGLPNQIKNTHLIGKAIIEKKYEIAISELCKQKSEVSTAATNYLTKPEAFFEQFDKRIIAFYQSAYYSYLWNEQVTKYFTEKSIPYSTQTIDSISYQLFLNEPDVITFLKEYPFINNTRVIYENESFIEVVHPRKTVIETEVSIETISEDELNKGNYSCQLTFYLPSGCYATMAIPQFLLKFTTTESIIL